MKTEFMNPNKVSEKNFFYISLRGRSYFMRIISHSKQYLRETLFLSYCIPEV